ncbi:MAG: LysM peptidoglycan-binding domain-containing protein [Deltaproteobacteria bacterium]|nr:LysM peptidoglycan-binding domain-containing protein [Deltaproteobacteria bacterium]
MWKIDHQKYILSCLSVLLLLLSFIFMAPDTPRAGEKTPPCYPEGYRPPGAPAREPDVTVPVTDFSSVFRDRAASATPKKTPAPPFDAEGRDPADRVPGIDDPNLRTEEYVVKEGDWLVKILRKKGLLKDQSLSELLSLLRKLNSSMHSLDMIRPGEKIIILVKVVPDGGSGEKTRRTLRSETYRIKRGDILSRLAMQRYDLSRKSFNREYLKLFSACNPSIKDPDNLRVGQTIKLPLYPPEYADTPEKPPLLKDLEPSPSRVALTPPSFQPERVKPPAPEVSPPPQPPPPARTARAEPAPEAPPVKTAPPAPAPVSRPRVRDAEATIIITDGLGTVISRLGEEWIRSGEHFIPMKTSGHINLKAESYPIVRLNKGLTVIVDMHSALPKKMAKVIESTWASYRVVQLTPTDDLRSALDKILRAFKYPKIYKKGQPLTLGGNIPVSITGDWIIAPPEPESGKGPGFIVINLTDSRSQALPRPIRNYLKLIGVEVIEYPGAGEEEGSIGPLSAPETAEDPEALIKAVLNLTGQPFTTQFNIPAYESRDADFKFTVTADFYLERKGKDRIIDVTGLNSNVISLLKDNGTIVLSLAKEKEPVNMVSRILEFLNVRFNPGPHSFMARKGDPKRNVKLTLPGIVFKDRKGGSVLVTSLDLPSEITVFLSQRGYRVLVISPFSHADSQSA